jgi:spore coat protein U-like protein
MQLLPQLRPSLSALKSVIALAGLWMLATPVQAATSTTTFQVTATVNPACSVAASNLAFGIYDPAAVDPTDGTTTLNVTCSNGTPYVVGLDEGVGQQATLTQRKLTATSQNFLFYALYVDAGHSTVWGDTVGVNTVAGTGAGTLQSLTVHGRIPAQQVVTPATFTDTITVTLTY